MDYLTYAFNLLLLLFWIRLWSAPDKEFYFNPFLSGTVKITDSVLAFLRPVLYLPEQAAAVAVLLFGLLFKTLLLLRLQATWTLSLGTFFQFSPPAGDKIAPLLLFSVLHFAAFLLKLWSVYLLVRLITPPFRATRATEAFAFFARPFSRLPPLAQPAVLLLLHAALAFTVSRAGVLSTLSSQLAESAKPVAVSPFLTGPLFAQVLKTGWLAALSLADGLSLLTRALFILILGNLAAALLQAHGALIICGEGAELLLGRFARNRVGMQAFDFTPLIFFFVVDMMYNGICLGLYNLIHMPLFN